MTVLSNSLMETLNQIQRVLTTTTYTNISEGTLSVHYSCFFGCSSGCVGGCQLTCTGGCMAGCKGGCAVGCEGVCQSNCAYTCSGMCAVGCEGGVGGMDCYEGKG